MVDWWVGRWDDLKGNKLGDAMVVSMVDLTDYKLDA